MFKSHWKLMVTAMVTVLASVVQAAGVAQATPPPSAPTVYYLALGDSLSTGGGAGPGLGYVNDIYAKVSPLSPVCNS